MASPRALLATCVVAVCSALAYDVVIDASSAPAACPHGCARWSALATSYNTASQSFVSSLWASGDALAGAGTRCAMPAHYTGEPGAVEVAPTAGPLDFDFSLGPLCYCAGTPGSPTSAWGYCGFPSTPSPAQVNLLMGPTPEEVVVSFMTVDWGVPLCGPPLVELCPPASGACVNVSGTSTRFNEPQGGATGATVYTVHNVPLHGLVQDGGVWRYRVWGGLGAWGGPYTFQTRAAIAPLSLAIVGDLGPYPYACFSNLLADATTGYVSPGAPPSSPPSLRVTGFVALGDHAYNMAMGNGSRGDGYMLTQQAYLTQIPWAPVMGNHELEGSPFGAYCTAEAFCQGRYLNQTSGMGVAARASGAAHGSRYYSLSLPLLHLVVLDYNPYIGLLDLDDPAIKADQLAWLASDLSAVNRSSHPWVIIAAHVPMYCSGDPGPGALLADIEPLMLAHGVDLHVVGHQHLYESTWPVGPAGAVPAKSFISPRAPVHVVTGAGGAPAFDDPVTPAPPFSRLQLKEWSYSRLTVWNASALTWQQVSNMNGTVLDEWSITQANHGPWRAGGAE